MSQEVVEAFLNAPVVSVAEAIGSPVKRRIFVKGTVSSVSNIVMFFVYR